MPPSILDLNDSSCPSLHSNQNLQKIREIFVRGAKNYKNSLQKLFSDSKVAVQDEFLKPEFFTYYSENSRTFLKNSDQPRASDTQTKLTEFLRNCIFSNHFFSCKNEPKTKNKACMCKPIRRWNKTDVEPITTRDTERGTGEVYNGNDTSNENINKENDSSTTETVPFIQHKEQDASKELKDIEDKKNWKKKLIRTAKKKPKEDLLVSSNGKVDAETNGDPAETENGRKPKIILQLPIDLGQFYQASTGDLKVILCDNKKQDCYCKNCCGPNVLPRDLPVDEKHSGRDLSKKKKAKKSSEHEFEEISPKSSRRFRRKGRKKAKGVKTDTLFADGETSMDEDNLDPQSKAFSKEKKPKKSFFDYCKCFKRKTKSRRNQVNLSDSSEVVDKQVWTTDKKKVKTFAKCCRCNKYDTDCPMSGEQIDTLKLLIKMEAKQNYRQINNIIKELNDQQDDIRKLKETYARIAEHFPKILGRNGAQGDNLANFELQQNVKKLFGMYKDLSQKINDIYKLSEDIVKSNSKISNEKTESDYTSQNKSTADQLSANSKASKTEDSSKMNSYENNLGGVKRTAGVSATNGLNYDELPEKLPKSETATKKPSCPCELNWGIYVSNSAK